MTTEKTICGERNHYSGARAADLMGVLEALKLNHPVIAGHSMGADTCIHFAATHPEVARAIFFRRSANGTAR